ncbi:hypothetical protein J3R30DRAFT_3283324, partial [Lentinula aciculospora]
FLRRMLGLWRYSMITPLYTETGIMPIRSRRVILALTYLLKLPRDHYASHYGRVTPYGSQVNVAGC